MLGHKTLQMVKRYASRAGVERRVTPHLFRHTYAHEALAGGMQEGEVMALAGWRTRDMLSRYAKSADGTNIAYWAMGEGPALVEDAEADLAVAGDGACLAPLGHRRDQELVVVGGHVVHDRHGGPVVESAVAEDAGAVREGKGPAFRRQHLAVGRNRERFTGKWQQHRDGISLAPREPGITSRCLII